MEKVKEFLKEKTKSVRVKLFLSMSMMILFMVIFLILANSFLIEDYYLHSKEKSLIKAYETIRDYVSANDILRSEIELEIE